MINNGYINKKSISFSIDALNYPLNNEIGKFMLIQNDVENPNVKYIWYNGNVRFPPLERILTRSDDEDDFAIIGKRANIEDLPSGYKILGYFNTPYSNKLSSAIWLVSTKNNIDLQNGNNFVFNSPNIDVRSAFEKFINNNVVKEIKPEYYGSYLLQSNKTSIKLTNISLCLIGLLNIAVSTLWIRKDKNLISILYFYGFSINQLFRIEILRKVFPIIFISTLLICLAWVVQFIIYPLWDQEWILKFILALIGNSLFLLAFVLKTILYLVKKGGNKI